MNLYLVRILIVLSGKRIKMKRNILAHHGSGAIAPSAFRRGLYFVLGNWEAFGIVCEAFSFVD